MKVEMMDVIGSVCMSACQTDCGMIKLRIRVNDNGDVRWASTRVTPDEAESLLRRGICETLQTAKGRIVIERNEKALIFCVESLLYLEWGAQDHGAGCDIAMRTVAAAREFANEANKLWEKLKEPAKMYNGGAAI